MSIRFQKDQNGELQYHFNIVNNYLSLKKLKTDKAKNQNKQKK
jgi:hypothetical protein